MKLGINLATSADSWKVVKRAEELGYSRAWFYDTHLVSADVFVAMAASAMATSRIRLGTGVLIPSNRIAPVAANALASVNALAPGRVDFGISTGNTARSTMGLGPMKLADMKEYIRIVQALLAGETVEWDFEEKHRKIRFLNPELGAINIKDPIPLHLSAAGPKARRLTAELDAHWMVPSGTVTGASAAIEDMNKARKEAGRDPRGRISTVIAAGCVLRDGEAADSPRAKKQAGPHAAITLHNMVEAEVLGFSRRPVAPHLKPLVDAYREIYLRYEPADARYLRNHRGHLIFVKEEEAHLCTAELIQATTFTATKPELVERMRALRDAGYDEFSVTLRHGCPEMLEEWADLFAAL
jgi:5,10-methylenetetrahydromethanopterin reductase